MSELFTCALMSHESPRVSVSPSLSVSNPPSFFSDTESFTPHNWELAHAVQFSGTKVRSLLACGDVVSIRSTDPEASMSGLVCVVREESFAETSSTKIEAGVSVLRSAIENCIDPCFKPISSHSTSAKSATTANKSSALKVIVVKLDRDASHTSHSSSRRASLGREECVTIGLVEVVIAEQYTSRADQWRYRQSLLEELTSKGGSIFPGMGFTYAKMNAQIKCVWSGERQVCSGVVNAQTKVTFRSSTAKWFLFLQMSEEMWHFDHTGNLLFENAVEGYLNTLFHQWTTHRCTHELNLVLFSRTYFKATCLEDFPEQMRSEIMTCDSMKMSQNIFPQTTLTKDDDTDQASFIDTCVEKDLLEALKDEEKDKWRGLSYLGERTDFYQDFFQVVALGTRKNYSAVLNALRKALGCYRESVLPKSVISKKTGEVLPVPPCFNSSADTGNVLEAINMALNIFCNHYIDRNFATTGQSVVVVSPASGLFEVERELSLLTKQRMIDFGIRVDFVCLGPPPLHIRPLFKFTRPSDEFFIPLGFTQVHYSPKMSSTAALAATFMRNDTLHAALTNGGTLQIAHSGSGSNDDVWEELSEEEEYNGHSVIDSSHLNKLIADLVCPSTPNAQPQIDVGRQKKPSLSAFNFHSPSAVVWGNYGSMDDLDTRSSAGGVKHSKNAPSTPAPTAMSSTPPSNSTLTSGINHIQSYRRNNPFSFPASSASNMKSQNKETKQSLNPLRSIESQKAFQESANRSRWVDCYPKSKEDTSENLSPKNSSRFSKNLQVLSEYGGNGCRLSGSSQVSPRVSFHLQDDNDIGRVDMQNSLTVSLDTRPKRTRQVHVQHHTHTTCHVVSNSSGEKEDAMGSFCICEADQSVQVDWPLFVQPSCLPVTTSFKPDKKELDRNFYLTNSDFDLESCCSETHMAARPELTVQELYTELVSQRVLHGYQVISASSSHANATAASFTANETLNARSSRNQDVVISTFLSKGSRSHHEVKRIRGYELDTVKCVQFQFKPSQFSRDLPLDPTKLARCEYKYQLKPLASPVECASPHMHTFEPTRISFGLEDIDSMKWVAIDNHIMNHEQCPYIFEQNGVKFWRSRFCILPVLKKSNRPELVYDFPQTSRELLEYVHKFCRIIEYLNGIDLKRKGAMNLRLPQDQHTLSGHVPHSDPGSKTQTQPAASEASTPNAQLPTITPVDHSAGISISGQSCTSIFPSTPEKRQDVERSRKKSKQQNPAGASGSVDSSTSSAILDNHAVTLNSPNAVFLEYMLKSNQVPLFDLSKSFMEPAFETHLNSSFLGIDACRWGIKFLNGSPSEEAVVEKFQDLLENCLIYPTVILADVMVSDDKNYKLPPKLDCVSKLFIPGFVFYTVVTAPQLPEIIAPPRLPRNGERGKSILFSWDTFEVMTSWCEQNSSWNESLNLTNRIDIASDLLQKGSIPSESKKSDGDRSISSESDTLKLMTTPHWGTLRRILLETSEQDKDKDQDLTGLKLNFDWKSRNASLELPAVNIACKSVDGKRHSDRHEYCFCAYNILYHPLAAFQMEFQWLVASGPLLSNMIKDLQRKCEQNQFNLVPIPMDPFPSLSSGETNKLSPLARAIFIPLLLTPGMLTKCGSSGPSQLDPDKILDSPDIRMRLIVLQKNILSRFGFLHSSCVLPKSLHRERSEGGSIGDNSRNRVELNSDPLQFIHATGFCFCSIPDYLKCDRITLHHQTTPEEKTEKDGVALGFHYVVNTLFTRRTLTKQQEAETLSVDRLMLTFAKFCQNENDSLAELAATTFETFYPSISNT